MLFCIVWQTTQKNHGRGSDAETVDRLHQIPLPRGNPPTHSQLVNYTTYHVCVLLFSFLFKVLIGRSVVGLLSIPDLFSYDGERRASWMVSFCNFSSFRMRTTLTLWSKLSLSSLKILKGFSKISPLPCQYYYYHHTTLLLFLPQFMHSFFTHLEFWVVPSSFNGGYNWTMHLKKATSKGL